ncbi:hypothetical protein [Polymorphobacter fuscus]|uniref:Type IV secretion system protein VirB7 n=1 Tax=Sandarakinorhabdus fusca TaxID=1439888 RepID=A0A7C9GYB2_9SPHN|nr:hypothetical protein [Polymorphobacter fuscus]KAB7645415.1 hypothetical protein F9290_11260 [Polymorphobacter fuscus]MQT17834.1 hypothetical protein [Polymorphobacter fuscus]NJC08463.1 hypothetical protein [Polymorphobacter fuscus]
MRAIVILALGIGLSGCATTYSASNECARTAGCTSSFASSGYGPIQAQAAEPLAPSRWQPQR